MMWKQAIALSCAFLVAGGLTGCWETTGVPHREGKAAGASSETHMVKKDAKAIIARTKGLDVWEIKPKEPYTDSDLNYRNDNSRVSREHQDRSLMPEIDGDVPGWDSYETVFLGYPIWWGEAPNIVYHFVRSHDFSGKQVIPFCTSHSSGLGDSDVLLEETAKSGEWFPGTRFSGRASESDLIDWSGHF